MFNAFRKVEGFPDKKITSGRAKCCRRRILPFALRQLVAACIGLGLATLPVGQLYSQVRLMVEPLDTTASFVERFVSPPGAFPDSMAMAGFLKDKVGQLQREAYLEVGGTPFLDREYTVFGKVIEGLDVLDKIAAAQTDGRDRPVKDIAMKIRLIH